MLRTVPLSIVLTLLFALVPTPVEAFKCPDGSESHAAAAGEVDGVAAGTQTCTQGTAILNGGCDTNPYPFLEQRHQGDKSNSFITPRQGGGGEFSNGLNPSLACRLKKFMEFAETRGCPLKINSAMRPLQKCNPSGGACAPQGRSCHQYGLAVDVAGSASCLAWVLQVLGRQNANSPFGIHSAYSEHQGYRHLQCVENLQAACSRQTRGCDGKVNINPDTSGIPNPSTSPSSQLSDAIRQALGQQPQQPPQQPPPPPPPQQQTTPTTQPTSPTQNTNASVPSQVTPISDILNTNSNTNTNTNTKPTTTKATSSIDLIGEFLDDPTSDSIDIGTAVDIDLNPDTSDVTSLDAKRPTSTRATGTLAVYQGLSVPQTFTSNDLANNPGSGFRGNDNTFTMRLLDTMKKALLLALGYLKPFGGYTPAQAYTE